MSVDRVITLASLAVTAAVTIVAVILANNQDDSRLREERETADLTELHTVLDATAFELGQIGDQLYPPPPALRSRSREARLVEKLPRLNLSEGGLSRLHRLYARLQIRLGRGSFLVRQTYKAAGAAGQVGLHYQRMSARGPAW